MQRRQRTGRIREYILPRYEEMLERFYEVTKDKEKGIYSTNLSADELNYIIDKK